MTSVFVVQHLHRNPDESEEVKMIGIYRTAENARAAVDRLRSQPGFREFPRIVDALEDDDDQGFHIDEYPLDKDHWIEGYSTYPYKERDG